MKPTLAALVLIAALAAGCAGIGPGAHLPLDKPIDSAVLAEFDQGAREIPVAISILPAGPLKSVDEETAKVFPSGASPEAIEHKELQIAKSQGKQIDEARLAALKEILKVKAAAGAQRLNEIKQAVITHNDQQFKVNQDKFIADAAKIKGLRIVATSSAGMVGAVCTPEAIRKVAALPYVSGIVSNRPVEVHQG